MGIKSFNLHMILSNIELFLYFCTFHVKCGFVVEPKKLNLVTRQFVRLILVVGLHFQWFAVYDENHRFCLLYIKWQFIISNHIFLCFSTPIYITWWFQPLAIILSIDHKGTNVLVKFVPSATKVEILD